MSHIAPTPQDQFRQSHGLEQFFSSFGAEDGLRVLDLGEFTQANVSYIVDLGHRLTFEDLLFSLDSTFGPGDPNVVQADARKAEAFLRQVLQFPAEHFDAILVWDTLEHLSRPLLEAVVDRLHMVLRKGGGLFACFHAEPRDNVVATFSFRIRDASTLALHPKGERRLAQAFNNRMIERVFARFHSVKFFLTRDYIREVVVRK